MLKKILQEIKNHWLIYFLLFVILSLALLLRVYHLKETLGFWYDQGRDALVIWDLLHNGKFFLIGPTTGIAGIFRGPWYYWLITPAYWLGKGNPIYPSVFLTLTVIVSFKILYYLGTKIGSRVTGLVAAFIASFSIIIFQSSKWLSNPTPMYLISMIFVWSMWLVINGKKWAWVLVAFMIAQAMQFGSAAEVFYIPAVALFALLNKKVFPNWKIILVSALVFGGVFLPQLIFDFRHGHILWGAIQQFIFGEGSFKVSIWKVIQIRVPFYFDVFFGKLWQKHIYTLIPFAVISLGTIIWKWKSLRENKLFTFLFILILSPIVGMLFFQGNQGNVYDYYFTGYYLPFILLFSFLITYFWEKVWGKVLLGIFILLFSIYNFPQIVKAVKPSPDSKEVVYLSSELKAIDWVYQDAGANEFNIDVYVPPVIPYAYDYLFKWYGEGKYGRAPKAELVGRLYTIYEVDNEYPFRLNIWMERQKGIGGVVDETTFGAVGVQKRVRINK